MAEGEYTSGLAAFAAGFSLARAPAEVVRMAKRVLMDQFGCELASATLPWSQAFRTSILSLGKGVGATVVYHGDAAGVDNAAFLNAAFGHGNEMDDACTRTPTHAGSTVIPAAMAAAERTGASGKTLLEAVVVGYEVMMRVSYATSPHLRTRGHHAPPALGPFGAAAAVAHVLGLDAARCANALAIAGSHSAGLLEYTQTGGSVKRIHCAIGSSSGLRSAFMARDGITGPPTVLEGERGFCKVFAGNYDPSRLTRGLGRDFTILQTGFKRHSCCFHTHTALEAMDEICAERGLTPGRIASVVVGMSEEGLRHLGGHSEFRPPKDIIGGQFSMGYCLALRLLRGGNGFWDWHERDLTDPAILELAGRVTTVVDEVANAERAENFGALVRVTTTAGETIEKRQRYSKGLPENPMTEAEFLAKFDDLAVPAVGAEAAGRIVETVQRVEALDDVRRLVRLLVRA